MNIIEYIEKDYIVAADFNRIKTIMQNKIETTHNCIFKSILKNLCSKLTTSIPFEVRASFHNFHPFFASSVQFSSNVK